jgi:poly-beta-1,6-N-acetyl-D-glucosamine synthase
LTIDLVVFLLFSSLYYALLLGVYGGLRALSRRSVPEIPDPLPTVSVIIAARNEQERIGLCLRHLALIDYPAERHEVILIDDHSGDNTAAIIADCCKQHPNWKLVGSGDKESASRGKRSALLQGIAAARGELIFTTDADCLVPRLWLKKMTGYFKPGVSMVLGYSPLIPARGFWNKLLQFDNLFSAVVSAAPAQLGYPFNSVGRNLAYRRDVYLQVGGYQSLKKFRSGDDVHLTERFRARGKGRIVFCADPETFVETYPPGVAQDIFQQQIRKNSKVLKVSPATILLFVTVFIYHVSIVLVPLLHPGYWLIWGLAVGMKVSLEWNCLLLAVKIFRQEKLRGYLPLMQLLYPFYIIFFSILGIFQKYRWKQKAG